ncbi:hypothetical protein A3D11_04215 [Candidatus Peribacteria bacterium RIFCSPHIGHO2_02_FULL_49_16]|nr:MAG: hypothetical protein A2880_00305 [Candidatus Peribacteria bacterium RIFCSPHIGHO2_01_FULL_49_38]OGJ59200.1 MAG: hypothetical protein A3D11_04215 [Candidatus Peribacteria bacterium RIFCSPHIGHO2_02_FULL_49_16]
MINSCATLHLVNVHPEISIPIASDKGGAREAFLHLLTFALLYASLVSLTYLYFRFVNELFVDTALDRNFFMENYSGVRRSLAVLIVTFPLFLWMSRLLQNEMRKHPEKMWSGIRRWLTYLTLLITALVLIGDVITLLFSLLEGDLSIRFHLKVMIVLVLAGLTFTYYFLSLKSAPSKH